MHCTRDARKVLNVFKAISRNKLQLIDYLGAELLMLNFYPTPTVRFMGQIAMKRKKTDYPDLYSYFVPLIIRMLSKKKYARRGLSWVEFPLQAIPTYQEMGAGIEKDYSTEDLLVIFELSMYSSGVLREAFVASRKMDKLWPAYVNGVAKRILNDREKLKRKYEGIIKEHNTDIRHKNKAKISREELSELTGGLI